MRAGEDSAGLPPGVERLRVWDPLLRAFHWLLAICVTITWVIGQVGPDRMTVHFWFGYVITGLLVFRLVWGLVGPRPARFVHFIRGPRAVLAYARGFFTRQPSFWGGHNPMGALSVVAMLAVLVMQVVTGMMSESENFIDEGPLASSVSKATRKLAGNLHELGATLILILVVIHVAVVLWYRLWKREDLIRPMITGWKLVRRR